MSISKVKHISMISVCLSPNEDNLLEKFLNSITDFEHLSFVIIYESQNLKTIHKKLQKWLNVEVITENQEVQFRGKQVFLFSNRDVADIAFQDVNTQIENGKHEYLEKFFQLPIKEKVFLQFHKNLGDAVYGLLKFNTEETCFLAHEATALLTPNQVLNPTELFNFIQEKWNITNLSENKSLGFDQLNVHLVDAFDEFLDIICLINAEGEFVKVSKATKNIWGYDPDEMIGRKYIDFVYENDVAKTINIIEEIVEGKIVNDFENRYVCKNGSLNSVIWSAKWDKKNKLLYCIARDATQIKAAQAEVARSNVLLKEAQLLANMGSWSYDVENENLDYSDGVYNVFGITEFETAEDTASLLEFVSHADREKIIMKCYEAIEKGNSFKETYTVVRPNNEKRYIELIAHTEKDKKGKVIRLFGTLQNISDKKKTELSLTASENRYKGLFENSPLIKLVIHKKTLTIENLNAKASEILGFSIEDLKKKHLSELLVTNEFKKLESKFNLIHKNKDKNNIDFGTYEFKTAKTELIKLNLFGFEHFIDNAPHLIIAGLNVTESEQHKNVQRLEYDLLKNAYQEKADINLMLTDFLVGLEKNIPELVTSILWVNEDKLYNYLSPSLPEKIINKVNGTHIDPESGSCGASAFEKKTIVVEDIRRDIKWEAFYPDFIEQGLISSWSHPIYNQKNEVIATFANYYTSIKKPTDFEYNRFKRLASVVGLVINNHQKSEALKASINRYKYATKATFDAIWDYDLQNEEVYWSEGFTALFGHEVKSLSENFDLWIQHIHPEDKELVLSSFDELLKSDLINWSNFYRFKTKEGNYAHVKDRCFVIRNKNAEAVRVVGAVQDITKQIKEDQQLRLLESVVKNTNDSVLITKAEPFSEPGPEIIYVNEAFTKMTGYTAEEVIGKTPRILQGPKTDQNELHKLSKSLRNWEKCEATLLNYKKNGEEFWLQLSISPVANEEGWFTHWIAIERDVTEQKQMELERKLLADISLIFNTNNFLDSVSKMLQKLIGFGDFTVAELWLTDVNKECLNLRDYQYTNPKWKSFYNKKHQFKSCNPGEGLPGIVWKDKNVILWSDIEKKPEVRRRKAAIKSGFNNVLGIPLIFNNQCIGVLAFGIEKIKSIHQNYDAINRIQNFLATEIQRKLVEDQLEQFTTLNPDVILILDQNGNIITANPAVETNLHFNVNSLIGKSFHTLVHSEDLTNVKQRLQNLQKQESIRINARLIDNKSNSRWFDLSLISNFRDQSYYILGKDITETKNLEELLDNATSLARIGSWELNLNTSKVYWSPITCAIHGVDAGFEPDLSQSIAFYKAEYRDLVHQSVESGISKGKEFVYEAQITTASGEDRWVKSIGKAEFRDGKCVRLFGSFQDIDAQKENEIKLQNLANNIPGVLFQYYLNEDGSDGMNYVSNGAKKVWQFTPEECMNNISYFWELTKRGGSLQTLKTSIENSAKNLSAWEFEGRVVLPDGQIRWHSGFGVPRRISEKTIVWDSIIFDITDKKDLEDLLKRSSSAAKIGSWEISAPNNNPRNLVYLSPTLHHILEFPEDAQLDTETFLNFFVDNQRELAKTSFYQLLHTGKEFDLELKIQTKLNKQKWIRAIGNAECVGNTLVKAFGSIQDITERKHAELKLVDSLNEKNTILESIGDGFFTVDNDWVVTYWNNKAEQILQRTKNDIIGYNLWEKFPDAVDSFFHKKYYEAKETKQNLSFEDYYATMEIWIEASVYPTKSGLAVYFKDITQRKKAEQEIRISNERFMRVAEATSDAIWDWNIEDNHIFWSEGLTKLFGHEINEFTDGVGVWGQYLHPDDQEATHLSLFQAIENKNQDKWKTEYRFRKKDGKYAYVVDRGTIIRDNKKKAIRMVGSITDISYQKEHEQSLQKLNIQLKEYTKELEISNAELEQFAYVASHDLQEPLRMVSSFLSLLEKKYNDRLDEKALQYINFAVDGSKRMRQIILDLLAFSRVGKVENELEEVNLNQILEDYKVLRKRIISDKSVQINYTKLPVIKSYAIGITQVFHNLLDNAIKYCPENRKPEIHIRFSEDKNHWKFKISDNGIGIEEEYFDKIFVIFQRLHSREEYSGTGMGLAIVKKIVESLNGEIWLESKLDEGTDFYFTIKK